MSQQTAAFLLSQAVEIRPEWKHLEWDTKAGLEHFSHRQPVNSLFFYIFETTFESLTFDSLDTFTFGLARNGMFSSQFVYRYWKKETCWPLYDCFLFWDESSQSSESKLLYVDPSLRTLAKTDAGHRLGGREGGRGVDVGTRKHPCRRRVMPR